MQFQHQAMEYWRLQDAQIDITNTRRHGVGTE
jgi:hypothetical protein